MINSTSNELINLFTKKKRKKKSKTSVFIQILLTSLERMVFNISLNLSSLPPALLWLPLYWACQ